MFDKKLVICGTARNIGKYFHQVFSNIYKIQDLFINSTVIVFYDESDDNTERLLSNENIVFIKNKEPLHDLRVARICNGRNKIIEYIEKFNMNPDYMIMMDFDDVTAGRINLPVLIDDLNNDDHWDCMTYNKQDYYDIFALCYNQFTYNCWSYGHLSPYVVELIKRDITQQLDLCEDYIEVKSAFNGFGLYKYEKFKGIKYHYHKLRLPNQLPLQTFDIPENCEHIPFHLEAITKNKAKIKINKKILFPN
jgi:hypothetical protein